VGKEVGEASERKDWEINPSKGKGETFITKKSGGLLASCTGSTQKKKKKRGGHGTADFSGTEGG